MDFDLPELARFRRTRHEFGLPGPQEKLSAREQALLDAAEERKANTGVAEVLALMNECRLSPANGDEMVVDEPKRFFHADSEARMDELVALYQKGGLLGLIAAMYEREKAEDRAALKGVDFHSFFRAVLPILASVDKDALECVIRGNVAEAALSQSAGPVPEYFEMTFRSTAIGSPVIYGRHHVNARGQPPSVAKCILACDFILDYLERPPAENREEAESAEYVAFILMCVAIDNINYDKSSHNEATSRNNSEAMIARRAAARAAAGLPPLVDNTKHVQAYMIKRIAKRGVRRYARKNIDLSYVSGERNSPTRVETMKKFFGDLRSALLACPEKDRDALLGRAMGYIGWAASFHKRLPEHERHHTSAIMGLWEATFLWMFREGHTDELYDMRTLPTALIVQELGAGMGEVALSVLANCYSWNLNGFSSTGAGQSVHSGTKLSAIEWSFCAHMVMESSPLQKNLAAETAKLKGYNDATDDLEETEMKINRYKAVGKGVPEEVSKERARYVLASGFLLRDAIAHVNLCVEAIRGAKAEEPVDEGLVEDVIEEYVGDETVEEDAMEE